MTRKAVELNDLKIIKKYVDDEIKEKVADALKEVVKQGNRLYSVGGFEVVDEQKKNTLFEIDNDGTIHLTDSNTGGMVASKDYLAKIAKLEAIAAVASNNLDLVVEEVNFPGIERRHGVGVITATEWSYGAAKNVEHSTHQGYTKCTINGISVGYDQSNKTVIRSLESTVDGVVCKIEYMAYYINSKLHITTSVDKIFSSEPDTESTYVECDPFTAFAVFSK